MNQIKKQHELTINISAQSRSNTITNTTFFSMDVKTGKKIINFTHENEPVDLTAATVMLGFEFVGNHTSKIIDSKDGTVVIEDAQVGRCSVILPNYLYDYEGQVLVHVYIKYEDGRSLDCGVIVTEFEESWLDRELPQMSQFYVKRFEDLVHKINARANEILEDLDSGNIGTGLVRFVNETIETATIERIVQKKMMPPFDNSTPDAQYQPFNLHNISPWSFSSGQEVFADFSMATNHSNTWRSRVLNIPTDLSVIDEISLTVSNHRTWRWWRFVSTDIQLTPNNTLLANLVAEDAENMTLEVEFLPNKEITHNPDRPFVGSMRNRSGIKIINSNLENDASYQINSLGIKISEEYETIYSIDDPVIIDVDLNSSFAKALDVQVEEKLTIGKQDMTDWFGDENVEYHIDVSYGFTTPLAMTTRSLELNDIVIKYTENIYYVDYDELEQHEDEVYLNARIEFIDGRLKINLLSNPSCCCSGHVRHSLARYILGSVTEYTREITNINCKIISLNTT